MASLSVKLASIHPELRKSLQARQPSKLLIFFNSPNETKRQLSLSLPIDNSAFQTVEFQQIPPAATHLCFWWYAKDLSPEAPSTASLVLQGVGFLPVRSTPSAEVHLTSVGPLRDRTYPHMAHLTIRDLLVKSMSNAIPLLDCKTFDAYGSVVAQELFGREYPQHAAIQDNLLRWPDSNIYMAFPEHRRAIPAWIFTWNAWADRLSKSRDTTETIGRYLECCKARWINNTNPEWTEAEHMEVACEAAVYLPLLLPYRKDRVLAEVTEQYTSISQSPAPLQAAIDCEDASEAALRIIYRMQHDPACSQNVNPVLCGLLQEYEFMFCVVTMKTLEEVFYHAVVMGFDKKWIHDKVDSPNSWFRMGGTKAMKHQCVLLECTDFIASHYGFNASRETEDAHNYHLNPLNTDSAWHTFVPPKVLRSSAQYHHLISAYTPQWIESKGVGEIAFYYEGGLGVPLTELLCNHQTVIDRLQVRTPSMKVSASMLTLAKRVLEYAPPYKDLPKARSNPSPIRPLSKGSTSFTRDQESWKKWQRELQEANKSFVAASEVIHANVPLYYITLT